MKEKNNCILILLIAGSAVLFSILGIYWNTRYYHQTDVDYFNAPPLAFTMQGVHDKLFLAEWNSFISDYSVPTMVMDGQTATAGAELLAYNMVQSIAENIAANLPDTDLQTAELGADPQEALNLIAMSTQVEIEPSTYSFTTATDEYFDDACFIGDSRTVGISQYAGIDNATFLCQTSLSIYDYEKPKIKYDGKKTSIKEVLMQEQFAKIYLMMGINECGTGTSEYFYEHYLAVVEDIRSLQPDALIFIEGNLLVTQSKSNESTSITNERLSERNAMIATIANQRDIFYIDINESSLCENGALVPDYTWDQIHIKAQYYPVWKEFLLQHAIVIG